MRFLTLALIAAAIGAQPAPDVAREQQARQIETLLIAPCCWTQPVSDHRSPASDDVKRQIRALLEAGKTREQVLDAFVEQYGPRILAEPPARGIGWLLYLGLPLVFLLTGAGLVVFIRRVSTRRPPQPAAVASVSGDEAGYAARLDQELRDLD
jgi:cytochrome c-type biogenesis protein CcmH